MNRPIFATLAALLVSLSFAAPQVAAQDGTPGATPATSAGSTCAGTGFPPGLLITLTVDDAAGSDGPMSPEVLTATVEALARRAAAISPDGCGVVAAEDGTVAITLAEGAVPNIDAMLNALTASAQLEIVEAGDAIPMEGDVLPAEGTPSAVGAYPVILSGTDIVDAAAGVDANGLSQVTVTLAPEAADRFAAYTAEHIGTTLAILLDGVVISTPVIQAEIAGGTLIIQGNFDAEATETLATQLRSGALPTPVTVVSVGLVAAPSASALPDATPGAATPAASGEVPGVATFAITTAQHTTTSIDYGLIPPVGGMHDPAWQNCGVYDAPIRNEHAVHSLEHGVVWITYRPDLPVAEVEALRQLLLVNERLIVSPYPGLDAPIVLSTWDRQLRLDTVDDPRLFAFIDAYQEQAPEPGASCEGRIGTPA